MKSLAHLQTRLFNTPLAIDAGKLEVILHALAPRLGLDVSAEAIPSVAAGKWSEPAENRQVSVTSDGICIIPIEGTLLKKASGLMAMSGCCTYESIAADFKAALESSNVRGILLDIDSPGGEVHGMFDLAKLIYGSRGHKPIYAVSNDAAMSAAYAIASAADRIFVTSTGGVGSIGVFALHVDQSQADAKAGLKYTYIKAGAKKTEGNPHEPLSKDAQANCQAEVDREYQMFVELVATNRKKSVDSIINTEAAVFFAQSAIPLLADEVGSVADALAAITKTVTGINTTVNSSTVGALDKTLNTVADNSEEELKKKRMAKKATKTEAELNKTATILADKECEQADEPYMDEEKDKKMDEARDPEDPKDPDDDEDPDEDEDEDKNKAGAVQRIVNLCTLAGQSDLAASFINKGLTVKDVEKQLLALRAKKSETTKINSTLPASLSAFDRLATFGKTAASKSKGSKSEAYAEMLASNPHLYDAYLEERDLQTSTPKAARQYLASMRATLAGVRG